MAVKHMILNEIPTTKILIIDVENEYNHLCKKLNGKVIECDGIESVVFLNPLQLRINRYDEKGFTCKDRCQHNDNGQTV